MGLSKEHRIIVIRHIPDTNSEITSIAFNKQSRRVECGIGQSYFVTPHPAFSSDHDVHLFPFLLNADGSSWQEANVFLFEKARNKEKGFSGSDSVRSKASMLLDYKIFCEENDIDLLNLKGRKPTRPTYRYFSFLFNRVSKGELARASLNRRTKVVYEFYKHLASRPKYALDLERVDTVKSVKLFLKNSHGFAFGVNVQKRDLSIAAPRSTTEPSIGYVREYGEDLRPLSNQEVSVPIDALRLPEFSTDERLMHFFAMETGARKQSILTLRLKHLEALSPENMLEGRVYRLNVGPGTGVDTKYDKPQTLYVPKPLAESLKIFVRSPLARRRREKFRARNGEIFKLEDQYVFLSPEGEPHYMAKDDPRYKVTKSRPQGRNTFYLKKKIFKHANADETRLPKEFTFHWLRATFALRYYRSIQRKIKFGNLDLGLYEDDLLSMVQRRLHHEDRTITQRYLRLFDTVTDDRVAAQELYEQHALNLYPEIDEGAYD